MRRSLLRAAATAVATTVAAVWLGACGSGAAPLTAAPGSSLRWVHCDGATGPTTAQCASLQVPGSTVTTSGALAPPITIALDRIPATGRRIGALVIDPGGPGLSAVDDLPAIAGLLGPSLRSHFDLIGYDPPGVGHSTPVRCLEGPALAQYLTSDPDPPGPDGFAALVATARSFAAACQASSGPLLGEVSTLQAARDLDVVRAALGDARLTYLGFSYGTLLGATYASLFPSKVRALVLDGALDPSLAALDSLQVQAAAVDASFAAFASHCRAAGACRWTPGPDPVATFEALVARARSGALRGAGAAQVLYGTAQALYTTATWGSLDAALAAAARGDGQLLASLFDRYVGRSPGGAYASTIESETAVNCTDGRPPRLEEVAAAVAEARRRSPVFGPLDVGGEATCSVWPAGAPGGPPHALSAEGSSPILVVGSTGDPITPYAWAVHLAEQLGTGHLLTRDGDGHTAYGVSGCVRSAVDAYLSDLRLPPPGTTCPTG